MDYKEKVRLAKEALDSGSYDKETIEYIFPELKESEDERIRGNIIATIHLYYGEPLEDEAKEMIAWLEKQGEQKHDWNEEDEHRIELLKALCEDKFLESAPNSTMYEEMKTTIKWLNSIRPQPKWTEDDEKMFISLKTLLNDASCYSCTEGVDKILGWLKSLKQTIG